MSTSNLNSEISLLGLSGNNNEIKKYMSNRYTLRYKLDKKESSADDESQYNLAYNIVDEFICGYSNNAIFVDELIASLENQKDSIGKGLLVLKDSIKIVGAENHEITGIDGRKTGSNSGSTGFYLKKDVESGKDNTYRYGIHKKEYDKENYVIDSIVLDAEEGAEKIKQFNKIENNKLLQTKENTSFVFMMVNNPRIRSGYKNLLQSQIFFNYINNIELAQMYPYFDIKFIFPNFKQIEGISNFKAPTLNTFLDGYAKNKDELLSKNNYYDFVLNETVSLLLDIRSETINAINIGNEILEKLENNYNIEYFNKSKEISSFIKKQKSYLENDFSLNKIFRDVTLDENITDMSIFCAPQSLNNFDDLYTKNINDQNIKSQLQQSDFKRTNIVKDPSRPFMTLKDFTVDVAPTQGLLSFKTAKLSLILHDRSRLSEIAPFIRADSFGASGTEIMTTYGWTHSGDPKDNFLKRFLESNMIKEKYIITNSSFNITQNGEVNIDLSLAMRGPIDIRSVEVGLDSIEKILVDKIITTYDKFSSDVNSASEHINFDNKDFLDSIKNIFLQRTDDDLKTEINKKENVKKFKAIKKLSDIIGKQIKALKRLKYNKTNNFSSLVRKISTYNGNINRQILGHFRINKFSINQDSFPSSSYDDEDKFDASKNLIIDLLQSLKNYCDALLSVRDKKNKQAADVNEITKKIIGGLGNIDPFYDKSWLLDYYAAVLGNKEPKEKKESPIKYISPNAFGKGSAGQTDYVSLGTLVSALIGTHLCNSKKYDEVQVISFMANKHAGLMSFRNLASLLIPRKELHDFLYDLFKNGDKFTIEGILTQIITRFISTKAQICFGLGKIYTRDENTNVTRPINKKISNENLEKNVNEQLEKIYKTISDRVEFNNFKGEKIVEQSSYKFTLPKIKFLFDTFPHAFDSNKTILRISIYDQNDNPFNTISEVIFDKEENSTFKLSSDIAKIKLKHGSNNHEFGEAAIDLVKDAKDQGIINIDGESNLISINSDDIFQPLKSNFKKIIPSMTFGQQSTPLIDANITTINEAKLNTIYLTRSNSAEIIKAKAQYKQDLPLQVLPSQANVTMIGFPFVNFAQMMFLDFETGTTVDNVYNVTGIKHSMSPGKFTTSLTLSYGDVYGSFRTAASNIAQAVTAAKSKESIQLDKAEVQINSIADLVVPATLTSSSPKYTGNINIENDYLEIQMKTEIKGLFKSSTYESSARGAKITSNDTLKTEAVKVSLYQTGSTTHLFSNFNNIIDKTNHAYFKLNDKRNITISDLYYIEKYNTYKLKTIIVINDLNSTDKYKYNILDIWNYNVFETLDLIELSVNDSKDEIINKLKVLLVEKSDIKNNLFNFIKKIEINRSLSDETNLLNIKKNISKMLFLFYFSVYLFIKKIETSILDYDKIIKKYKDILNINCHFIVDLKLTDGNFLIFDTKETNATKTSVKGLKIVFNYKKSKESEQKLSMFVNEKFKKFGNIDLDRKFTGNKNIWEIDNIILFTSFNGQKFIPMIIILKKELTLQEINKKIKEIKPNNKIVLIDNTKYFNYDEKEKEFNELNEKIKFKTDYSSYSIGPNYINHFDDKLNGILIHKSLTNSSAVSTNNDPILNFYYDTFKFDFENKNT